MKRKAALIDSELSELQSVSRSVARYRHLGAFGKLTVENSHSEGVLDQSLNCAFERSCPVVGVIAFFGEQIASVVADFQFNAAFAQ